MRFEFYHSGLDDIPKLSVDGTVDNAIHFSHWQGNETPAELKADTSTEIALNLVASPNEMNSRKVLNWSPTTILIPTACFRFGRFSPVSGHWICAIS